MASNNTIAPVGAASPGGVAADHSRHPGSGARGPTVSFSESYRLALNRTSESPVASPRALRPLDSGAAAGRATLTASATDAVSRQPSAPPHRAAADDHIHEKALALRAYRLQLIASNIANADTPGYKAVDIDVEGALRSGRSSIAEVPLKYVVPTQASLDGNTVELDSERAKFAQTALMYEFSLEQALGHYKHLAELFRNMKD